LCLLLCLSLSLSLCLSLRLCLCLLGLLSLSLSGLLGLSLLHRRHLSLLKALQLLIQLPLVRVTSLLSHLVACGHLLLLDSNLLSYHCLPVPPFVSNYIPRLPHHIDLVPLLVSYRLT
jgi:hypothetical protein